MNSCELKFEAKRKKATHINDWLELNDCGLLEYYRLRCQLS